MTTDIYTYIYIYWKCHALLSCKNEKTVITFAIDYIFLLVKYTCDYKTSTALSKSERMKLLAVYLVSLAIISFAKAQTRYVAKPGSCPPPLPVQSCGRTCYVDAHCAGIGKCCPTRCGGAICSMPVTNPPTPNQAEKPGSCPSVPTGRWVCSSTCSSDSDCRADLKCCKNRCGALACQKPEIEVIEPTVGVPIASRFGYDYNYY